MTDYYRLGRQYAFRPERDYVFDDLPAMSPQDKIEFDKGYADCIAQQTAVNRMLVVLCVLTVVACAVFWWFQK